LTAASKTRGQLVRFLTAGAAASLVTVLTYLGLVAAGVAPMIANLLSFLLHVTISFLLHSRWSFGGWGGDERAAGWRYLVTMLANLAMNSAWVWLLVTRLQLPGWTPVIPMLTLTPAMSFVFSRIWVFAR